jgi:hypothetical protein
MYVNFSEIVYVLDSLEPRRYTAIIMLCRSNHIRPKAILPFADARRLHHYSYFPVAHLQVVFYGIVVLMLTENATENLLYRSMHRHIPGAVSGIRTCGPRSCGHRTWRRETPFLTRSRTGEAPTVLSSRTFGYYEMGLVFLHR